ncbi:MAG: ATP-binding protein, partial [Polyangiaceae bacterium]|nr:ATP-binding protein [Polyangiaceae bacterium]
MSTSRAPQSRRPNIGPPRELQHYRELLWHTLARQMLLYFLPLLLLAVFFHFQYRQMIRDSHHAHLMVLAEQQANTLDLFLRERLVNLANLIDDLEFAHKSSSRSYLQEALQELRQTSPAFVDLGVVDGQGNLAAYVGPVDFKAPVNYAREAWFLRLAGDQNVSVITDMYQGLRGQPHFTIAVKRTSAAGVRVVRSALSPERLLEYIQSLEGAQEVNTLVVNADGVYQLVTRTLAISPERAPVLPPRTPQRGPLHVPGGAGAEMWAYAWMRETPWALVVHERKGSGTHALLERQNWVLFITVLFFIGMGVMILIRARQIAGQQIEVEQHEAELSGQLAQAVKLASVGELAAGIAHEINNPLAIIAEEVGFLKDCMNPEFGDGKPPHDLPEHLDIMHDAVFRCRDITRKLLTFVRQTDIKIEPHRVETVLDEVISGMLAKELLLSNVEIVKQFDSDERVIVTDRNQLVQVFLNLIKNAVDAMPSGGTLTVRTEHRATDVVVVVQDTGVGMTPDQMKRVFMPFFTTKA